MDSWKKHVKMQRVLLEEEFIDFINLLTLLKFI